MQSDSQIYQFSVSLLLSSFLRCFRNPIRVPRISNRVPRIRENYHRVPRIRENRVLTGPHRELTFSLKQTLYYLMTDFSVIALTALFSIWNKLILIASDSPVHLGGNLTDDWNVGMQASQYCIYANHSHAISASWVAMHLNCVRPAIMTSNQHWKIYTGSWIKFIGT